MPKRSISRRAQVFHLAAIALAALQFTGCLSRLEKLARLHGEKLRFLTKGCSKGDARTCTKLGYAYKNWSFQKYYNRKKALEYLIKGCNMKDADGCHKAAEHYTTMSPQSKYYPKAAEYYRKACDLMDIKNCRWLGWHYRYRLYDFPSSVVAYHLGCSRGDLMSCRLRDRGVELVKALDRMFKGVVLDPSQSKAEFGLKVKCRDGDIGACHKVGENYLKGKKDFPANTKKGLIYLRLGCKLGHDYSCYMLYQIFKDGRQGYKRSIALAYKYAIQDCKHGYQEKVDKRRITGRAVGAMNCRRANQLKKKYPRAFVAAKCAAGHGKSCYQMSKGILWYKYDTFMYYYREACRLGYAPGCRMVAKILKKGFKSPTKKVRPSLSRARKYTAKACDANDLAACRMIGRLPPGARKARRRSLWSRHNRAADLDRKVEAYGELFRFAKAYPKTSLGDTGKLVWLRLELILRLKRQGVALKDPALKAYAWLRAAWLQGRSLPHRGSPGWRAIAALTPALTRRFEISVRRASHGPPTPDSRLTARIRRSSLADFRSRFPGAAALAGRFPGQGRLRMVELTLGRAVINRSSSSRAKTHRYTVRRGARRDTAAIKRLYKRQGELFGEIAEARKTMRISRPRYRRFKTRHYVCSQGSSGPIHSKSSKLWWIRNMNISTRCRWVENSHSYRISGNQDRYQHYGQKVEKLRRKLLRIRDRLNKLEAVKEIKERRSYRYTITEKRITLRQQGEAVSYSKGAAGVRHRRSWKFKVSRKGASWPGNYTIGLAGQSLHLPGEGSLKGEAKEAFIAWAAHQASQELQLKAKRWAGKALRRSGPSREMVLAMLAKARADTLRRLWDQGGEQGIRKLLKNAY